MEALPLYVMVVLGCFIWQTTAQTALATTTQSSAAMTMQMPAGTHGAYLSVTPPSSSIASGVPVNLTCVFQSLPITNNIFLALTNSYGSSNIVQVSTVLMAAAMTVDLRSRLAVFLLDDGVSLQFQYMYMKPADSGVYQCYVTGGASSNMLSLTVNPNSQFPADSPGQATIPQLTYDYSGTQQGGINIPLVIAVTIGVACLLVSTVLLVLRLKYRDRFFRMVRARQQRPPTYANAAQATAAGVNNPVYVVDAEQLPSYNDALKLADSKVYMPPNYTEVVGEQPATSSSPNAAGSMPAASQMQIPIPSVYADTVGNEYSSMRPTRPAFAQPGSPAKFSNATSGDHSADV